MSFDISTSDGDFNAVSVDILGRFMRSDQSEFPCRIDEMSPGSAQVLAPVQPDPQETIILYADHVGRLEGEVIDLFEGGFVLKTKASERRREKLAAKLTWLTNRQILNLPEDRRHARVHPENPFRDIVLDDGRRYQVKIIDLSLSGAAVQAKVRPVLGTPVTIGAMPGRIVRYLEDGFAIEFSSVLGEDSLQRLFR
ncbi:PilZ domain-containing protein [Fulvimarina sp. 2208YS6-2-32]|uniref:PilZ domain-containing protein n=1 Tax=Fulvimarina uroteuthidis TaxID=3098149 RepID=A0ABU5I2Y4_9HYPH|nr:PilZ domain-containing protein [Fulvimarina sp. 2208YS6-2-32]MDY8109708.1 PilZ domain-containing protein [Fulvimarina sp. 2208YS6-2-32]